MDRERDVVRSGGGDDSVVSGEGGEGGAITADATQPVVNTDSVELGDGDDRLSWHTSGPWGRRARRPHPGLRRGPVLGPHRVGHRGRHGRGGDDVLEVGTGVPEFGEYYYGFPSRTTVMVGGGGDDRASGGRGRDRCNAERERTCER